MKKLSLFTALAVILSFSSCEDDPILGCMDETALNYDELATEADGSCEFNVNGCTDALAINYNELATLDDGTCEYPLLGCMDPLATNFNELATADDESCLYFEDGIIGSWNGVYGLFGIVLSQETMAMIQMMDPNDFSNEFGVPMPSNEDEWNMFYETIFASNVPMEGINFEFDGTNFIMSEYGEIETTNYSFTTLTSFDVGENSFEVSYFDVLSCTETELVLYTETYDEEMGQNTYMNITFSK